MIQFFSRPDAYFGLCGDLRCSVSGHRISNAPEFMRGLRLAFVSDVHALPRTTDADLDALAERIRETEPDILLLGGDYADTAAPCRRFLKRVGKIPVRYGIFAAVGNNDREAFPDLPVLRRAASDAGIQLLVNESRTIHVGNGRLIIAGLDEYRHGHPDPAGLYPESASDSLYRVLISHFPRGLAPMPDLMLSGHTHGGQFNAFGITPYTVGFERVFKRRGSPRFIAGMHACRGGTVLVSKGIGASRVPMRVCVRPEIDVVVFT